MKKFISRYLNNPNKFVALAITIFVLISGFSFSTKSVKAAESSDKAITAFTVPIQTRTPLRDDFNSYNDGDLNEQGGWTGDVGFDIQGTTVYEGAKAVMDNIDTNRTDYISKSGTQLSQGKTTVYVKKSDLNGDVAFGFYEDSDIKFQVAQSTYMGQNYWAYLDSGGWNPSSIPFIINVWQYLEVEWQVTGGTNPQYRFKVDGGNWVGWTDPWSDWSIGVNKVELMAGYDNGGGIAYFDYIAENPYTEETPTTSIATINESAKTIALTMPYGTDVTALVPTITITGESVSPASLTPTDFTSPVIYTVTAADASTQDYTVTVTVAAYTDKAITAFNVPDQVGTTTINEGAHTIALTMPYGTDVTALVPTITITGDSVNPRSGVAHNFTTSSIYTVTAADYSTQDYTVTVTVALNPAKAITAFTVPDQVGTTTINESAKTIALTMPYGTDVTALVPTITITGESVSPASLTPTDFTSPVVYIVRAADSSTSTYTVTVTVALSPAKAITAFTVPGQAGTTTINESSTTIALTMPYGTDVTALVATFTITGSSIAVGSTTQESGTTTNDFTSPVIYTVTAADTTTQDYTVTVTVNPAPTTSGMGGGGGGGGGGAITMAISQETPTQVTSNSVKINWLTTLFSTSRVIYDTVAGKFNSTQSPNYGYAFSTIEQDTPSGTNGVTYHTVWINGLTPDTTYYYRAISHASPDTIGQEFSFTTAQGSVAEQLIPSEEKIPLAPTEEAPLTLAEETPVAPEEETPVAPAEETTPTSSPALFDILTQPEVKQSQRNLLIPILTAMGILILIIVGYVLYRRRRKKVV